ncbi:MAG: hypothetical protein PHR21_09480, partial [Oscillospiraceae bacterium]|nr:hypothetical protein [Oscillospiraceae bacterium]
DNCTIIHKHSFFRVRLYRDIVLIPRLSLPPRGRPACADSRPADPGVAAMTSVADEFCLW